jgi:hypothetical protein
MSEQAPPAGEDTPAVAGPEGSAPAEEIDWQARALEWEDRYGNLQPEYTRTTQELREMQERQELYDLMVTSDDPDTQRQAAEALGYEFPEEEPQEWDDPLEPLNERLGRIEESLSDRQEREQNAENAVYVRQVFDEKLDEMGIDKEDQDWVLAYAINALPMTEDGWPDFDQAYEAFVARENARQKKWSQTKRAPHISPTGQPGTEVPDLDDPQQRRDFIVRRMMENEEP